MDNHHVIPISMGGWDHPANVVRIREDEHALIHQNQNISFDDIRNFRRQTNHLDPKSEDYRRKYLCILTKYFAGTISLPRRLRKLQAASMKRFYEHLCTMRDVKPVERFNVEAKGYYAALFYYLRLVVELL